MDGRERRTEIKKKTAKSNENIEAVNIFEMVVKTKCIISARQRRARSKAMNIEHVHIEQQTLGFLYYVENK